jgi:hypothetical protein
MGGTARSWQTIHNNHLRFATRTPCCNFPDWHSIGGDIEGVEEIPQEEMSELFLFPIEANLRDFLIRNLHTFKEYNLKL